MKLLQALLRERPTVTLARRDKRGKPIPICVVVVEKSTKRIHTEILGTWISGATHQMSDVAPHDGNTASVFARQLNGVFKHREIPSIERPSAFGLPKANVLIEEPEMPKTATLGHAPSGLVALFQRGKPRKTSIETASTRRGVLHELIGQGPKSSISVCRFRDIQQATGVDKIPRAAVRSKKRPQRSTVEWIDTKKQHGASLPL